MWSVWNLCRNFEQQKQKSVAEQIRMYRRSAVCRQRLYGWKPSITVKVPFGFDGNKGFYLSGVTASSIRWIRTSVKFPKVYIDLKGDKYDYFVDALKFIGQVVRKYDDVYPNAQHWNMLFEDYSRDYRIPPEDDKERYPIYLSACSMQNKLKKYFEIHSLCKERVCK